MAEYHKYVFDTDKRLFVGDFEGMYRAEEKEHFDSWHKEDMRTLNKKICLAILEQYNFSTVLDLGCAKGTFTHLLKKANNSVTGVDVSQTALQHAKGRYPDIGFECVDLVTDTWADHDCFRRKRYDCIVSLELFSYLANWREIIATLPAFTDFFLISLFIPDNPIGFVKSEKELIQRFSGSFEVLEDVRLISRQNTVLFGRSRKKGD